MSELDLVELSNLDQEHQTIALIKINRKLEILTAEERISWALESLPEVAVMSSSFGVQAAVSLHLVTCQCSNIPVILADTGYLFPETYQFIDQLTNKLALNLQVVRADISPAWQEARYGKLWEQGVEGIELYNKLNKVDPINRFMETIGTKTWFAGLRRNQSNSRAHLSILTIQRSIFKFCPIIDWDNKQVHNYLNSNKLDYHPLWKCGYISIGDIHTTHKWEPGMREEDTRFFGLKRECGLHEG